MFAMHFMAMNMILPHKNYSYLAVAHFIRTDHGLFNYDLVYSVLSFPPVVLERFLLLCVKLSKEWPKAPLSQTASPMAWAVSYYITVVFLIVATAHKRVDQNLPKTGP